MDTLTIAIAAFTLLLLYGCSRFISDRLRYGRKHLPPGPTPLPFIGTLHHVIGSRRPYESYAKISKKYGPISMVYNGYVRVIILGSANVIREAIVANSKTFSDRPNQVVVANRHPPAGVLFESGEPWHRRRRFLMRSMREFGMGKMQIAERVQSEAEQLIIELRKVEGKPFNPRPILAVSVSNVICSLVFGRQFVHDGHEFQKLFHIMEKLLHVNISARALFSIFPILRKYFDIPDVILTHELYDLVGDYLQKSLTEYRSDFDAEHIRHFPDLFIECERGEAVADDGASIAISFTEFKNMMGDMFIAGTETTSTTLQWTMLYLAKWPEIQLKCQEAVDVAMGGSDRLPTLSDRANLVYLDAVFHEVLRYATIVPLSVPHANGNPFEGKLSGYIIPTKSVIHYNVWAVHHDRDYWGDPENFDPTRWIDQDGKLRNHSAHFMPFGVGPRICLGESLARVEYFIFLVALLQRFSFSFPIGSAPVDMNKDTAGLVHLPPEFEIVVKSR